MKLLALDDKPIAYVSMPLEDAYDYEWWRCIQFIKQLRQWCNDNALHVKFDTNSFRFDNYDDFLIFILRWS